MGGQQLLLISSRSGHQLLHISSRSGQQLLHISSRSGQQLLLISSRSGHQLSGYIWESLLSGLRQHRASQGALESTG
jgi:hypothetical protein